jgi:hypothetical protein
MENEQENLDSQTEETTETESQEEVDVKAIADRLAKLEETNKQLFEREKKAEAKVIKKKVDEKVEERLEKKQAELDETQLDYLDLKGINDPDEVEEVRKHMVRTGESLRSLLKDDWLINKLNRMRKDKEVNDATPGATRRSGGSEVNTVDYWLARYEQTGDLPKDFKLKSEVINRKVAKESGNRPRWQ